jgi:hypothetical protein
MLTPADLQELESSLLPALERHHLRLLAHSLRCLQQAAGAQPHLPDPGQLQAWAAAQPALNADASFIPVLLEQLSKAALQLEQIALSQATAPLSLTIADLVNWGRDQADRRLAGTAPLTAPDS